MKRLVISALILLVGLAGLAQDQVPLSREEKKIMRKEEKKQQEKMLTYSTAQAIKARNFVIKADQVRGRAGFMMNVNPTINFVAVNGDEAYVQLGSESGIGYNGVGGITLKGKITSIEINQDDRHGSYHITMNTLGTGGSLSIVMNINVTGEMATATVRTNWGSRVDFNGVMVPYSNSRIYTGKDIY